MYETELFDDLEYDEAEGAAEYFGEFDEADEMDELDEFDETDELDEFDEMDELDEYDDYDEFDETDELDEFDEMDELDEYDEGDDFESEGEEEMDEAMAYALGSEDDDEFFKKLWRGIKKVAKRAAPIIGKVARVAAPILSKIPTPWTQVAGQAARLLGQLRAEGASDEEALEVMAELAVKDKRALPIVAGVAARTLIKSKGKRMSFAARKKVVKDMKKAVKTLVRKRGRKAVRAIVPIIKSVKRTAAIKMQPAVVRTKVVRKAAAKVARSPRLTRKLSKPKIRAVRRVQHIRIMGPKYTAARKRRSFTVPGPARITISTL